MIRILCYGSGNVKAISNIYKRLKIPCEIARTPEDLLTAEKIVVPGVGAFDNVMMRLEQSGMLPTLNSMVLEKDVPVLGVCVGMQVMADGSEEGNRAGLGWIKGNVVRIDTSKLVHKPKLPHMGWNSITPTKQLPIMNGVDSNRGFYFLHSYRFECADSENILAVSHYADDFASAVVSGNIYGFQFHPEKSHSNGITIFRNFAQL